MVCRFRPFNESEKAKGVKQAVEFDPNKQKCKILLPEVGVLACLCFSFDPMVLSSLGLNGEVGHCFYI